MKRIAMVAVLLASTAIVQAQNAAPPAPPPYTGPTVERLDPALDALIDSNATVETLLTEDNFFEGPVWMHGKDGNFLLFSDLISNRIDKWDNGKLSTYLANVWTGKDNSNAIAQQRNGKPYVQVGPNGETLDKQGRLVFCAMGSGHIERLEPDGKITVLAAAYEGHHLNAPNDLVVKSDGTIYFTDIRGATTTTDQTPPDGVPVAAVYMIKDGKLVQLVKDLMGPNGIAFSPDEKFLYVNDIRTKLVWRYDVQADGTVKNGKVFIDENSDMRNGAPDGMKVDSQGNIWDSGPAGIWVVSPEGKHLGTIVTPERLSNLAWGDADGKTLYLTSGTKLMRLRVKVAGFRP